MRMMYRVSLDVEQANKAIKEGSLPKIIGDLFNDVKPEAAYFFAGNGKRTALFFFDMKDPSQIPVIAEPAFMGLNAEVEFTPVMNLDELKAGLQKASARF